MMEKKRIQDDVFSLLQSAFTREEVEEARRRYAEYLRHYPEDAKYDLAHGFSRTVAYLEDREREAARLKLSPSEIQEREALLRQRMPGYRDEREEDDFLTEDGDESFDLPSLIHPPVKSAQTRLLDMLVGWWRYIESDDTPDDADMRQKVYDLYQEAGTADLNDEAVSIFIRERVLPIFSDNRVK